MRTEGLWFCAKFRSRDRVHRLQKQAAGAFPSRIWPVVAVMWLAYACQPALSWPRRSGCPSSLRMEAPHTTLNLVVAARRAWQGFPQLPRYHRWHVTVECTRSTRRGTLDVIRLQRPKVVLHIVDRIEGCSCCLCSSTEYCHCHCCCSIITLHL